MAKGVLGNDPFRRGAAPRKADTAVSETKEPAAPAAEAPAPISEGNRTRAKAKRRVEEALAATPAGTEIKERPRKKKANGNRAGTRRAERETPPDPVESSDDSQQVTRAIQDATPQLRQEPEVVDEDESEAETPPSRREAAAERRELLEATGFSAAPSTPAIAEPLAELPEAAVRSTRATAAEEEQADMGADALPIAEPPRAPAGPSPMQAVAGVFSLAREVAANAFRSDSLAKAAKVADGVFTAMMTGIGASASAEVDPYGKDANLARKLTPISDFFYDRYWRVTVEGAPHVPNGPSILVANHSGAIPIDGFILHQALQKERPELMEARWLAEDQIFHAPFLGTLYNRLGAIRASPENAVRLLEEGRPVITFPEGVHGIRKPFNERYQLKRLGRGGFAKLAIRQRVSIVPVAIVGAEESMPLLAKLPGGFLGLPYVPVTVPPLPARWLIRFGEPIKVDHIDASAADDLLEVQRLVEKTRESIEGMLKALLKERRNVFGT